MSIIEEELTTIWLLFFMEVDTMSMDYKTKDVVTKVADYIEALPEGSRTTTYRILVKLYGEEAALKMDDFMLHFEIYDEIERRGNVIMDGSEHEGKVEGLPQNLDFILRRR